MSDVDRVKDQVDILTLHNEYCLRLEIDPFEDWMDLFTEDTVYEVHRRILTGRQEMAAMLSQAPHGVHIGGAARITIEGDTAKTIQNYLFLADEERFSNKGWYYRTLRRTGEGWKIAHTRVVMKKIDVFAQAVAKA